MRTSRLFDMPKKGGGDMAIFQRADILIPQDELLEKWPVIECDHFT